MASALAEAGPDPITQEELERLLHESGVRVVIRELQNAPQLLQDWELIEPADGGYRFRVELLRCWIAENKPLRRVQEELDRIEPVAESFYQAALGLYRGGQLDQAIVSLRQAVSLNPNHVGANQLLADILLVQGQVVEALQLLEPLYKYQPTAARPRLVQVYLALAQVVEGYDEQLAFYEHVLELDPTQPEAAVGRQRILATREKTPHLSARNPLDNLRLLWWVLVTPQRLRAYRLVFGEREVRVVGSWLFSTLIWLPFFVLTLALGLRLLPCMGDAFLPRTPFLVLTLWVILICWALLGYRFRMYNLLDLKSIVERTVARHLESIVERIVARGFSETPASSIMAWVLGFAALLSAGVILWIAILILILFLATMSGTFISIVASDILGSLALAVAFYVALGVASGAAFGMGDRVLIYVATTLTFLMLIGVAGAIESQMPSDVALRIADVTASIPASWAYMQRVGRMVVLRIASVTAIITAIIVTGSIAFGVATSTKKGLETGRPSSLTQVAFVLLMLAHVFIIWFSFLGGWRVFQ